MNASDYYELEVNIETQKADNCTFQRSVFQVKRD